MTHEAVPELGSFWIGFKSEDIHFESAGSS